MGDFADLVSPYLAGHSAGVAELAGAGGAALRDRRGVVAALRRAALVHDVGRVAVHARIWQKPGPLTPDEWEQVRLHPYHSERVLARSPFLAALAPVAAPTMSASTAPAITAGPPARARSSAARLLAAADAYHAMTEPRPHRDAVTPERAAEILGRGGQRRTARRRRGRGRAGGGRASRLPGWSGRRG